jgi:uncharacterized membrane-anchored protein
MNATRALILLGVALVLGAVDASILAKERVKRDGEVVFLELAPVDPRSLVQGDYMALDFLLARQLGSMQAAAERDGDLPLALDERRVARVAPTGSAPALHIHYRIRKGRPWLGTNAYFFQEGAATRYQRARFGEFRIDRESGEAVLVGLRDKDLKPIP